ncbi:MAG: 16S rRNA (guanine(966)-N(2))-methyltransferase RsmD [Armatimonadetes bacterium]|nr:16S rRNA (guanine(966)-N(2))-methyltransferase RsmD [Armatimonadota bacterium]
MRVIAGSAGGLHLKSRKGEATRPTLDRVRETLFSILGTRVVGACFLDLFAGTGAIGIEALSRGAKYAIFVESNPVCCQIIKENLHTTRLEDQGKVFKGPFSAGLEWAWGIRQRFDLVFVDPPYGKGLIGKSLDWIDGHPDLLAQGALVVTQEDLKAHEEWSGENLVLSREHRVGSTRLDFYQLPAGDQSCK